MTSIILKFIHVFFIIVFISSCSLCLHVEGEWNTSDFFKFLAKFGFQKTNENDRINTQGHIYGNITVVSPDSVNKSINGYTLVVADKEYFKDYYGNRSLPSHQIACSKMFAQIKRIAFDAQCNPNGLEDFLRKVPCPKDDYCTDEDTPESVISNYQFSYGVQDINQPRFWYVSLVACKRGEDCSWHWNSNNISIRYNIWLVNGDPHTRHMNPLEFQFSFHLIDTVEIYIVCFVIYTVLVITAVFFVLKRQRHQLIKLYFTCLCLELVSVTLHLVHMLKFSVDGEGEYLVKTTASALTNIAQCIFVLLLLLIAKGWTITTLEISHKFALFGIWFAYVSSSIFLFVWIQTEVSVISDVDEYQTWPGYLMLSFRLLIMCHFLLELRATFKQESNIHKLGFYLHFGAGFLVWFVYLPIVAVIAAQVSALWRTKLMLGITSAANILYYTILMHLLWPTRSDSYFQLNQRLASDYDDDEVEEFERDRIRVEKA